MNWLIYAVLAAVFAALTTILAKIGVKNVDSHLATAIRTVVVLAFAWVIVFTTGVQGELMYLSGNTWVFLVLSGVATGGAWLCYFRALKLGNVNKVTPTAKSSTLLTMVLAFIFLREPVGLITVFGMVLMGAGTWLMLELGKQKSGSSPDLAEGNASKPGETKNWLFYAVLSAVCASLVAIFGRSGVVYMDANLWTATRTVVVLVFAWLMVFITGGQKNIQAVSRKSWCFLVLSGLATGASWLFFYHALQLGQASRVVPIDKLSIVLTMGFARMFLGEKFTRKSVFGLGVLVAGTLLSVY